MHGYRLITVQSQKYALNTKEPAEPQSEMAGVLFFGVQNMDCTVAVSNSLWSCGPLRRTFMYSFRQFAFWFVMGVVFSLLMKYFGA